MPQPGYCTDSRKADSETLPAPAGIMERQSSREGYMHHCGYVAIVGRPNVGKSTLLNHLLGQKLSITSRKPQTTRHRLLGIKSTDDAQVIYVDTPGLHRSARQAMNRIMNRAASNAIADVDVVVLVASELSWTDEDDHMLEILAPVRVPVLLAINKVDKLKDKEALLPHIAAVQGRRDFAEIIPISARRGTNVERLEQCIRERLPESPPLFPREQITDRSERFLAAELVREKLMRRLGQEVPYSTTVEIETFSEHEGLLHIDALIWVESDGQKSIVIGKQGRMLKQVGQQAREEMARLFGRKVYLQLWVKVKENWSDDERALRDLGYGD